MVWAVRGRSSRVFGPSVWRGRGDRRAIALTFDDGPSESTPEVLRILEQHGARATFFQCGRQVERLPDVARAVASAGHEIGNHSWSHAPLYLRRAAFIEDEVGRAQEAIAGATGVVPRLFRAPYGARWFGLRPALRKYGLLGVMWTAIASDWRPAAAAAARKLLGAASNGAIFCLHDGRELLPNPDIRATLGILRDLIPELRARGFEFRPVSELICLTN
jgi:peptidoglycan/xylan/chitin deacetylase (PgdA/CDA1 family)